MRKWPIIAAVTVLALALAGVAMAQFSQTSNITLTAHKGGKSSGIVANIQSSDPTAPGGKPKAATHLVITFPAGTKFNFGTKLIKPCTLSTKQLETLGGPSCKKSSKIGTGSAVANASPTLLTPVNASVTSYVRNKSTVVLQVVTHPEIAPPIVILETVSGSKLSIPVPTSSSGISLVLTSLKLNIPALGSGKTALVTSGKCVSHQFSVKSNFLYADGSRLALTSSSACSG